MVAKNARTQNLATLLLRVILSATLLAQPLGVVRGDAPVGTVVNGDATFDYNGGTTTITASDRAIIEYLRFNIGKDETVRFIQPGTTSRVLNRITGGDPSSILGRLQANGIVYFVNPAGIYFGQNAIVDAGQLYAAAGSLSNADFLARNDNFTRLSGQVLNEGTINAGAIHLVGQNVRNTGALNSPAGLVMLAAGDDVLIGERGGHLFVNATPATRQPNAAQVGVENAGQINAASGKTLLAAGDLYAIAVQNSGVIKSHDIQLEGQGGGEVWNRGTIDASSATATGGRVQLTGQYVGLDANSTIDASGATGGGEVLIGGDFQGKNTAVRNATATYVAEGARINADATASGAGGRVIVWADDTTRFLGNISARGVSEGGFAEVSGKKNLLYAGYADLRSTSGKIGTLLLDPDNITISSTPTFDTTFASGTFSAPSADGIFNLYVYDLTTQLGSADVTVKTNTGDITVDTAIVWGGTTFLILDSGNDIFVNANIEGYFDTGLVLTAARNITIGANMQIQSGEITVVGNGLVTNGGAIAANSGARSGNLTITSGTTNIAMLGTLYAENDIAITGALITQADSYISTNTGSMTVNAQNHDVSLDGTIGTNSFNLANASNITVGGNIITNSALSLTAANNITLNGGIAAGEHATLTAQSGTISIAASGGIVAIDDIFINGGLNIASGAYLGSNDYHDSNLFVDAGGRDITLGPDIDSTALVSITASNAANISLSGFYTYGAQTYIATNNINVHEGEIRTAEADDIILTAGGTLRFSAGSHLYGNTVFLNGGVAVANGAQFSSGTGGVIIDALGKDVSIATALNLPSLDIHGARYIDIGAVTTLEDQTYAFAGNGAGAMRLNGALVSESGDISIMSHSDVRAGYASIFSNSPDGIVITATGGNVTIGHNDTLLACHDGSANAAAGTISIQALNNATLGNLTASKAISVSAATITLDGDVYQAPGITLTPGAALTISNTNTVIATASGTGIANQTVAADFMTNSLVNPALFPLIATSNGAPFANVYERTQFWGSAPTAPVDETRQVTIAVATNPANEAQPQAEQQKQLERVAAQGGFQEITAATTISAATAELLKKLGIFARPLTSMERLEHDLYYGVLQQNIPHEVRAPEMYQVADGRISEEAALSAIDAWLAAFTKTGSMDPADSRVPELQAALLKTYRAFRDARPDAPVDEYASYIATAGLADGDAAAIRDFLENVRRLFRLVDNLGLTPNEAIVSKNVILRPLRAQGLPAALLNSLAQASPSGAPVVLAKY